MTSSSFVSPLDCLTSFLGISLSRAVSSFGLPVYSSIHSRRITNVPKLAITAESYIRSWRKPPEIPEVCRMARISDTTYSPRPLAETAAGLAGVLDGVAVWEQASVLSTQRKAHRERELLSPSTTSPLLQQSKGGGN